MGIFDKLRKKATAATFGSGDQIVRVQAPALLDLLDAADERDTLRARVAEVGRERDEARAEAKKSEAAFIALTFCRDCGGTVVTEGGRRWCVCDAKDAAAERARVKVLEADCVWLCDTVDNATDLLDRKRRRRRSRRGSGDGLGNPSPPSPRPRRRPTTRRRRGRAAAIARSPPAGWRPRTRTWHPTARRTRAAVETSHAAWTDRRAGRPAPSRTGRRRDVANSAQRTVEIECRQRRMHEIEIEQRGLDPLGSCYRGLEGQKRALARGIGFLMAFDAKETPDAR
jgi:hypothetical protein